MNTIKKVAYLTEYHDLLSKYPAINEEGFGYKLQNCYTSLQLYISGAKFLETSDYTKNQILREMKHCHTVLEHELRNLLKTATSFPAFSKTLFNEGLFVVQISDIFICKQFLQMLQVLSSSFSWCATCPLATIMHPTEFGTLLILTLPHSPCKEAVDFPALDQLAHLLGADNVDSPKITVTYQLRDGVAFCVPACVLPNVASFCVDAFPWPQLSTLEKLYDADKVAESIVQAVTSPIKKGKTCVAHQLLAQAFCASLNGDAKAEVLYRSATEHFEGQLLVDVAFQRAVNSRRSCCESSQINALSFLITVVQQLNMETDVAAICDVAEFCLRMNLPQISKTRLQKHLLHCSSCLLLIPKMQYVHCIRGAADSPQSAVEEMQPFIHALLSEVPSGEPVEYGGFIFLQLHQLIMHWAQLLAQHCEVSDAIASQLTRHVSKLFNLPRDIMLQEEDILMNVETWLPQIARKKNPKMLARLCLRLLQLRYSDEVLRVTHPVVVKRVCACQAACYNELGEHKSAINVLNQAPIGQDLGDDRIHAQQLLQHHSVQKIQIQFRQYTDRSHVNTASSLAESIAESALAFLSDERQQEKEEAANKQRMLTLPPILRHCPYLVGEVLLPVDSTLKLDSKMLVKFLQLDQESLSVVLQSARWIDHLQLSEDANSEARDKLVEFVLRNSNNIRNIFPAVTKDSWKQELLRRNEQHDASRKVFSEKIQYLEFEGNRVDFANCFVNDADATSLCNLLHELGQRDERPLQLDISNNMLTSNGVEAFVQCFLSHPNIEKIIMESTDYIHDGAVAAQFVKELSRRSERNVKLKEVLSVPAASIVDLSSSSLYDRMDGVSTLLDVVEKSSCIDTLFLHGNYLSEAILVDFAEVVKRNSMIFEFDEAAVLPGLTEILEERRRRHFAMQNFALALQKIRVGMKSTAEHTILSFDLEFLNVGLTDSDLTNVFMQLKDAMSDGNTLFLTMDIRSNQLTVDSCSLLEAYAPPPTAAAPIRLEEIKISGNPLIDDSAAERCEELVRKRCAERVAIAVIRIQKHVRGFLWRQRVALVLKKGREEYVHHDLAEVVLHATYDRSNPWLCLHNINITDHLLSTSVTICLLTTSHVSKLDLRGNPQVTFAGVQRLLFETDKPICMLDEILLDASNVRVSSEEREQITEGLQARQKRHGEAQSVFRDILDRIKNSTSKTEPLRLDLTRCFLLDADIHQLCQCIQDNCQAAIEILDLEENAFTTEAAEELFTLFAEFVFLFKLKVSRLFVAPDTFASIYYLNKVRGCHWIFFKSVFHPNVEELPSELELAGLHLECRLIEKLLERVRNSRTLHRLDLADNSLSESLVEQVAKACLVSEVESLSLEGNQIYLARQTESTEQNCPPNEEAQKYLIPVLQECYNVLEQRRKNREEVVAIIAALRKDELSSLKLQRTHIASDLQFPLTAAIRSTTRLRHINVSSTPLMPQTVGALKETMEKSPTILTLDLGDVDSQEGSTQAHIGVRALPHVLTLQRTFRRGLSLNRASELLKWRNESQLNRYMLELKKWANEGQDSIIADLRCFALDDESLFNHALTLLSFAAISGLLLQGNPKLSRHGVKQCVDLFEVSYSNVIHMESDVGTELCEDFTKRKEAKKLQGKRLMESYLQQVEYIAQTPSETLSHLHISLSGRHLSDQDVELLCKCFLRHKPCNSQSIILRQNGLTDTSLGMLEDVADQLPSIIEVDVEGNHFLQDEKKMNAFQEKLKRRRERDRRFDALLMKIEEAPLECKTIDLSRQEIGDSHVLRLIDKIPQCALLESIDVSFNKISPFAMGELFNVINSNERIIKVDLRHNALGTEEGKMIEKKVDQCITARNYRNSVLPDRIKHMSLWRTASVNLSALRISDEDIDKVRTVIESCSFITRLSLSNNILTNRSASALLQTVMRNESIRFIELHGNERLTAVAFQSTSDICQCRNQCSEKIVEFTTEARQGTLFGIGLVDMLLTDAQSSFVLQALRNASPVLRYVNLSGNAFSSSCVNEILSVALEHPNIENVFFRRNLEVITINDSLQKVFEVRQERGRRLKHYVSLLACGSLTYVDLCKLDVTDDDCFPLLSIIDHDHQRKQNESDIAWLQRQKNIRLNLSSNPRLTQATSVAIKNAMEQCWCIGQVDLYCCPSIPEDDVLEISRRGPQNQRKMMNEMTRIYKSGVIAISQELWAQEKEYRKTLLDFEEEEFYSMLMEHRRTKPVAPKEILSPVHPSAQVSESTNPVSEVTRNDVPVSASQQVESSRESPVEKRSDSSKIRTEDRGGHAVSASDGTHQRRYIKPEEFDLQKKRREAAKAKRKLRTEMMKKAIRKDEEDALQARTYASSTLSSSTVIEERSASPESSYDILEADASGEMDDPLLWITEIETSLRSNVVAEEAETRVVHSVKFSQIVSSEKKVQHDHEVVFAATRGYLTRLRLAERRISTFGVVHFVQRVGRGFLERRQEAHVRDDRLAKFAVISAFLMGSRSIATVKCVFQRKMIRCLNIVQQYSSSQHSSMVVNCRQCFHSLKIESAAKLQRNIRAFHQREIVHSQWSERRRMLAAKALLLRVGQGLMCRLFTFRDLISKHRHDASMNIQRVFRGYLGRQFADHRIRVQHLARMMMKDAHLAASGRRLNQIASTSSVIKLHSANVKAPTIVPASKRPFVVALITLEMEDRENIASYMKAAWRRILQKAKSGAALLNMKEQRNLSWFQREVEQRNEILHEEASRMRAIAQMCKGHRPTVSGTLKLESHGRLQLERSESTSWKEILVLCQEEAEHIPKTLEEKIRTYQIPGIITGDAVIIARFLSHQNSDDEKVDISIPLVTSPEAQTVYKACTEAKLADDFSNASALLRKSLVECRRRAQNFASEKEQLECESTLLNNLAVNASKCGQHAAALQYITDGMEKETQCRERCSMQCLINAGTVNSNAGNPEKALVFFREALQELCSGVHPSYSEKTARLLVTLLCNMASAQTSTSDEVQYAAATYHTSLQLSLIYLGSGDTLTKRIEKQVWMFSRLPSQHTNSVDRHQVPHAMNQTYPSVMKEKRVHSQLGVSKVDAIRSNRPATPASLGKRIRKV